MKKVFSGLVLLTLAAMSFGVVASAEEVQKDGKTYWKVESTDTLSEIGEHYGIDYNLIADVNDQIKNVNLIYDDDLLLIPTDGQTTPAKQEEEVVDTAPAQEAEPVKEEVAPAPAPQANTSSSSSYSYSQFMSMGVINWNGYKYTYYSQSVLPGGGLNIPGRHVSGGFVRDADGYIVLANSSSNGTILPTPFGQGKVYDKGTYGNHIDIYVQ